MFCSCSDTVTVDPNLALWAAGCELSRDQHPVGLQVRWSDLKLDVIGVVGVEFVAVIAGECPHGEALADSHSADVVLDIANVIRQRIVVVDLAAALITLKGINDPSAGLPSLFRASSALEAFTSNASIEAFWTGSKSLSRSETKTSAADLLSGDASRADRRVTQRTSDERSHLRPGHRVMRREGRAVAGAVGDAQLVGRADQVVLIPRDAGALGPSIGEVVELSPFLPVNKGVLSRV